MSKNVFQRKSLHGHIITVILTDPNGECTINYNWCQDLETELGNAGIDDSVYYQKRTAYCDEFYSIFPESDELLMHNMKKAIAESHFALGSIDEGNKCFKQLIEQYPRNMEFD